MQLLLRFRMGRHRMPSDEGSWSKPTAPRLEKACMLCTMGTIGDETQLLFECPELQEGRNKWASLFSGPDTGQNPVWQEDPISVAELINECLDKVYALAPGPSHGGQASDRPDVAASDVI